MATNLSLIPDNKFTTILTEEENQMVFSLLDINFKVRQMILFTYLWPHSRQTKTLSTTLVRLLVSESPEHRLWGISCVGIACLAKDFVNGVLFIKIFDFIDKRVLWEHQLSDNTVYKSPEPLLFAFEINDGLVGINFSVEEEALHFRDTLTSELFKGKPQTDPSLQSQGRLVRKSVSKDDINSPTNFRHSLRVFFNPLVGFEVTKPNDSNHKNKVNNSSDNSSNEVFESEDEIQVEEAFQFLHQRDDSICSYDSNVSSISQRPVPKARTTVGSSSLKSVCVQTEQGQTLYSALVNKFFEPVNNLTPPPIIKAMTYLASRSDLDQLS